MYSSFDFLSDVVNKVPNLGGTESGGDEKGVTRRRKTLLDDGDPEANEELRSPKMPMRSANVSSRGRGRGRGRGRPPSIRTMEMEKDNADAYRKFDDEDSMSPDHGEPHSGDVGGTEKENVPQSAHPAPAIEETKTEEEPPAWPPLPHGAVNMGIDPSSLVSLNMHMDEDEDYDNED